MDLMETISHIWHVFVITNTFNFLIFAAIIIWIFKKINAKAIIDSLHAKVVETIETAKKTKEEAHGHLKEVEKSVENLPEVLNSILQDASKSAEVIEKKLLEDAQKQVEHIRVNAEKVIEAEEKMLTSKLTKKASKASVELAKSHIQTALEKNPQLHEKYINDSIEELDRLSF